MTDVDPRLRRVVFELPNEHVPELLGVLGDFALHHNIGITLEDAAPETTEASLTAERYNPNLITQIKDKGSGEDIKVVSCANLQYFATERDGHPMAGTRLYNAVMRGPAWMSKELDKNEYKSMITGDADGQLMLRADKVYQLLAAIQTGTMVFNGLRQRTAGFLSDFYNELVLSEPHSD